MDVFSWIAWPTTLNTLLGDFRVVFARADNVRNLLLPALIIVFILTSLLVCFAVARTSRGAAEGEFIMLSTIAKMQRMVMTMVMETATRVSRLVS